MLPHNPRIHPVAMRHLKCRSQATDAKDIMYREIDKWRAASRKAGARMEACPAIVRFSRKLLVSAALFLIIVSVCDVL